MTDERGTSEMGSSSRSGDGGMWRCHLCRKAHLNEVIFVARIRFLWAAARNGRQIFFMHSAFAWIFSGTCIPHARMDLMSTQRVWTANNIGFLLSICVVRSAWNIKMQNHFVSFVFARRQQPGWSPQPYSDNLFCRRHRNVPATVKWHQTVWRRQSNVIRYFCIGCSEYATAHLRWFRLNSNSITFTSNTTRNSFQWRVAYVSDSRKHPFPSWCAPDAYAMPKACSHFLRLVLWFRVWFESNAEINDKNSSTSSSTKRLTVICVCDSSEYFAYSAFMHMRACSWIQCEAAVLLQTLLNILSYTHAMHADALTLQKCFRLFLKWCWRWAFRCAAHLDKLLVPIVVDVGTAATKMFRFFSDIFRPSSSQGEWQWQGVRRSQRRRWWWWKCIDSILLRIVVNGHLFCA